MTLHIDIKTTRTKSGKARATLSRFFNYSQNKVQYAFRFYNVWRVFDKHNELRSFILEAYDIDIGDKKTFWGW